MFKASIKTYVMNESLSWEERYQELETHHIEETNLLIGELTSVRGYMNSIQRHEKQAPIRIRYVWEKKLERQKEKYEDKIKELEKKLEEKYVKPITWEEYHSDKKPYILGGD